MRKLLLWLLFFAVAVPVFSQSSNTNVLLKHATPSIFHMCREQLGTDTWTCASGSTTCTATGAGTALSGGELIVLQDGSGDWKSFEVAASNAGDITTFERLDERTSGAYVAIAASDMYQIKEGLHATTEEGLCDGAGNASTVKMSQNGFELFGSSVTDVLALELTNEDPTAAGETTQTTQIGFYLFGSSDSGSTWAKHEAARIEVFKVSDGFGSDESDFDFGLRFYTVNGGVIQENWKIDQVGNWRDRDDDLALTGVGVQMDSDGAVTWSSTGSYTAEDLYASRYQNGSSNEYLEIDDNTGTASDGTGTGRLLIGAGSAAAPALSFGGDLTTGLYQSVAGRLNLSLSSIGSGQYTQVFETHTRSADVSSGDRTVFNVSGAGAEITDTNGRQAMLSISDNITQTGTAALDGLLVNATINSLGDGSTGDGNNLLNLQASSVSKFKVDTDGDLYPATIVNSVGTLGDTDTTPDVSGSNVWWSQANTGATAITDLDNPLVGAEYTICVGSATNAPTIADGGAVFMISGNWTPGIGDCIKLLVKADNEYYETGRSDN